MKSPHLRAFLLAAVLPILFAIGMAAQAPLEPAQMPPRTIAYLIWRGAPAGDARKANSLMALWDDPDFASVRSALFDHMMSASEKGPSKPGLTREEAEQFSSLLENSFVLGYIGKTEAKTSTAATAPAEHPWNGFFIVYDRSGKEKILSQAVLRMRSQEKDVPQVSEINIGGVPVLKVERQASVTYWVEHGNYAAGASERAVLEEILPRLESTVPASASLAQSAAYQEARPMLGGGLVEFFARIPDLKILASDSSASGIKIAPLLNAMKLEAIHSLSGHVSLEGSKTRFQAALLGDTAPGAVFDLWSEGQQTPGSLALVPPDAVSYSETQFNLTGFYQFLKRVGAAVLPPGQGNTDMLDTLAQTRLGMPLQDALALFSGEFASMQTSPAIDPQKAAYVLGIRKKPETVKLLHTIFSDQLTAERSEGDASFFKISMGGGQGRAGVAQWNFYHVAVTPDFLIATSRNETLRAVLAAHSQASPASGLAARPQFQAARARYPEKLDGVYYFDFQKVDWPALKDLWMQEVRKASTKQTLTGSQKSQAPAAKTPSTKIPDFLTNANPEVFPRHLHFMAGASWKDAQGIHFDQWLE